MTQNSATLTQQLGLHASTKDSPEPYRDEFCEQDLFEESHEYRAFICSRGTTRQADMLICSLKDGTHVGFEYSHRYRCNFDETGSIHLEFSEHEVRISGLRLDDGYLRLCIRKVLRLVEADKPTEQLLSNSSVPLITGIEILRREDE